MEVGELVVGTFVGLALAREGSLVGFTLIGLGVPTFGDDEGKPVAGFTVEPAGDCTGDELGRDVGLIVKVILRLSTKSFPVAFSPSFKATLISFILPPSESVTSDGTERLFFSTTL